MCRKLVVTNQLSLGNRILGVEVFSLPRGEVLEFTLSQLKSIIRQGKDQVYGLKLTEENELELDDAFYTRSMMNKTHINSLKPISLDDEETVMVNLFYIVIGTHTENNVTMYDVISSRYERNSFTAEKVKTLLELHIISAGATLNEKGEIVVAPLEKVKKPVEEKKVPVEEVKVLEEKPVAEVNPVEKEKSLQKENPVPVAKKEPEKVVKVEEKKKA